MTGVVDIPAVDGALPSPKQRWQEGEHGTGKLGRRVHLPIQNPRRRRRPGQTSLELVEPHQEFWEKQETAVITEYLKKTATDFFDILEDYQTEANKAANNYWKTLRLHARWRVSIIIATGFLAVINICVALKLSWGGVDLSTLIATFAALYAAGLAVAASIENFLNKGQKATAFRESRELLVNYHREYYFNWLYYVEAYGESPMACMNAGRLYYGLVNSDQELRQKLKELTEVRRSQSRQSNGFR